MTWAELLRSDRLRFEIKLKERAGITIRDLVHAGNLDPQLAPKIKGLSREARELRVVEFYCDEGHPQPEEPDLAPGHVRAPMNRWESVPPLETAAVEAVNAKRPRHRPPDPISTKDVKQLMWELDQRKARPDDSELTQEKIAGRVGLDDTRVQQAEALQRLGWPLLRTHPDFPVDEGFVRWPGVEKAAQLLASEHAEN